jgi:hypothetical protein
MKLQNSVGLSALSYLTRLSTSYICPILPLSTSPPPHIFLNSFALLFLSQHLRGVNIGSDGLIDRVVCILQCGCDNIIMYIKLSVS